MPHHDHGNTTKGHIVIASASTCSPIPSTARVRMHHQILHTTASISSVRDEDAPSPQPLLYLRRDEDHDANLNQVQRATILHIALCIPRDFLSAARMWLSNAVYPCMWPSRKGSFGPDMKTGTITFRGKGNRLHCAPLHNDLRPLVKRAIKEKRATLVLLPKYADSQKGTC